ncbi:Hsp70 ATPase ssc1 [Saitozyma podzolica]|uniref:Hsp70 ATPase ssc1 n=1 Tax=Saitozyma podzolica TaxID=1890683 RepID=A0A427YH03_9TREE|nr:Hsp70 ATPase ssc1 [Saitozyma podzolica]
MWSSFTYEEPSVSSLLILSSWLYLLNVFGYLAQRLLSAGLLGQILIGVIYGTPLARWLDESWEEAFVAIGYVGLLVVVFEGGMSSSISTLTALLPLSTCIALTGLLCPIAMSFVLVPMCSFSFVHAFAAGSALSSTSLGTVLAVLNPSSIGFDLRRTKLGTALLSAAIMDDVVAFILVKVLQVIGAGSGSGNSGGGSIGANIGRTIGVTIGLGVALLLLSRFVLRPAYRQMRTIRQGRLVTKGSLLLCMVLVFIGMVAAAGYAGTSPLYGAYIAGLACAYLSEAEPGPSPPKSLSVELLPTRKPARSYTFPTTTPIPTPIPSPPRSPSGSFADGDSRKKPGLRSTFEGVVGPLLNYLLLPIFFGSIGYCIPFVPLWQGRVIWRGIIYAILMILGKGICGAWLLLWRRRKSGWKGAVFIGLAMIARGEIGLLISQIAYHTTSPLLVEDEFLIITWAIVICTIVGPVGVGWAVKRWGRKILEGGWE